MRNKTIEWLKKGKMKKKIKTFGRHIFFKSSTLSETVVEP
jgi:hypothetical protein